MPSILGGDQKRFLRMDTLGEDYTPDALRTVIAGAKQHTPKKRFAYEPAPCRSGTLLIDIQSKLNEGKGAGYAWFAKKYNLKQISQTLLFLQENDLLDEAVLAARVEEATAKFNALSDQMKADEKRMAEISILQKHIQNYKDTRQIYVAYRKAGYSKKFRAEHEDKILLHQAAKNYFDKLGLDPLPKKEDLTREYAQLMAEKKAISPDYYKARDEMRELQIAKSNVDRVMNMEISSKDSQKVR